MEIAHYIALHTQCLQLWDTYFIGVAHAPVMYLTLGRSVEKVAFAVEHLCMESSHPSSRIVHPDTRHSAEKVLWLALYKLSALLQDIENLLQRLKVTPDKPPQWWLNFAQKARFGHRESFGDLTQQLDFHAWALSMTTKTFHREVLYRKLETFSLSAGTLETVLQQQFVSAGYGTESSSIRSGQDQGVDLVQEFIAFSDYHDGRDIFEAANIMTIIRLAMYWTHRAVDALACIEKTKSLPVKAYANILKAGWILQRLQMDQRSRSEECTAIMISLSEDVVFELKRINELKVILPTNEQLVSEADLRIWLDDLEENESETLDARGALPTHSTDNRVDAVSPLFSGVEEQDHATWQRPSPELLKTSVRAQRSSVGSDAQATSPLHASENEILARSPDSRTTYTTLASSIDAQQSSTLSHQSSLSSTSSNPVGRKALPRMQLPTLTEPLERNQTQTLTTQQKRTTFSPDSMQYGVPPLHSYSSHRENTPRETRAGEEQLSPSDASSPSKLRQHLERSPHTHVSDLEAYDPSNPPSNFGSQSHSTSHDYIPPSPMPDLRDLDERPGEVEIMKACFQSMILSASDSFEAQSVWESCSIRIFRKADSSVRLLTFRDSGIDQRFIYPNETEIVPEYGYHKDEPIVYLRRIRPESSSKPSTSQTLSMFTDSEESSTASLYYRFDNANDMFNFQLAFTGEAVEIDIKAVRTVRFKRSLLDGEHSNYKARIQLWREQSIQTVGSGSGARSLNAGSIAGTIRSQGATDSILKVATTRLVIFFEESMVMLFVTDSVAIEARARTNVIRIKPSSYRTFGNPSSVRARFLGTREQSGGMRLDKKGLTIDSEESFDEFKWFEIDFYSEEEMSYFRNDFCSIINERRKERRRVEDLKRLAANGVRSSR